MINRSRFFAIALLAAISALSLTASVARAEEDCEKHPETPVCRGEKSAKTSTIEVITTTSSDGTVMHSYGYGATYKGRMDTPFSRLRPFKGLKGGQGTIFVAGGLNRGGDVNIPFYARLGGEAHGTGRLSPEIGVSASIGPEMGGSELMIGRRSLTGGGSVTHADLVLSGLDLRDDDNLSTGTFGNKAAAMRISTDQPVGSRALVNLGMDLGKIWATPAQKGMEQTSSKLLRLNAGAKLRIRQNLTAGISASRYISQVGLKNVSDGSTKVAGPNGKQVTVSGSWGAF